MAPPTTPVYRCARCVKDFPEPLRLRDHFGNFYCKPCAQALMAASERQAQKLAQTSSRAQSQQLAPASAVATSTSPLPVQPPRPPPLHPGVMLSTPPSVPISSLAPPDAALNPDNIFAVDPAEPVLHKTRICVNCSKTVSADVAICAYCGHDEHKGLPDRIKKDRKAGFHCRKCGYDMAGLRTLQCPECGTVNRAPRMGHAYEQDSKEITRWAYLRPAIMLGVGLVGLSIMTLIHYKDPLYIVALLLKYALTVPTVLAVYAACCAIFIGFDMPLHLVALRIAGICAVVDLIASIFGLIPLMWIIPFFISTTVYVWMLAEELDIDRQDAVVIAILSWGAKIIMWALIGVKIFAVLGLRAVW